MDGEVVRDVISEKNWVHSWADWYDYLLLSRAPPNVMEWFLVRGDFTVITIVLIYAYIVNSLGPRLMKNRKPFDLRWLMVPYDICLLLANFCIFIEYSKVSWSERNERNCEPGIGMADHSKYRLRMDEITWYFCIINYIEFFDSIFLILRKKERQLSKWHKLLHSTAPVVVGLTLRGGVYSSFFPLAASLVCSILYTYYAMSALGEATHLKFKKYVPITRLIQLVLVISLFLSRPFYSCEWDPDFGWGNAVLAGFLLTVHSTFY